MGYRNEGWGDRGFHKTESQPGFASTMDVQGWEATYIGKGVWRIIPGTAADRCMTMTGAAVTLLAPIPINHRLIRFEWKHTDDAYANSAVATEAIMSRLDYEPNSVGAALEWRLYYEAASTSSTTVVPFGEGYEYVSCQYKVSFNTTNGHFIWPEFWIQEIKQG